MNLPFRFAFRYIFSKKSTNAINIISGISVVGIALGSAALIVILSVFNGFEDLLRGIMGSFKPDVKVQPIEGKVFSLDSTQLQQIQDLEGVYAASCVLEELSMFEHGENSDLGNIKGIDDQFLPVTQMDTTIFKDSEGAPQGAFQVREGDRNFAVVGAELAHSTKLDIAPNTLKPLIVYMPKRKAKMTTTTKFKKRELPIKGIYAVRQIEYDNFVFADLAFVQDLLSYKKGEISAIEIKLTDKVSERETINAIKGILGDNFTVKNRYEQDEAFFKITNMEKWVGFAIFAFALVLVAFNMIGALWMLVLEKRNDIITLRAMGGTNSLIRNIFLMEGFLLATLGVIIGCIFAVILCVLQQQFGLVTLGDGNSLINAYPVQMRIQDFALVVGTVIFIGILAAWLPAMRARRISNLARLNS
ncbi:MAG: FtsX-like permease family protein [Saprospiraceae bacterium]|nr:FtsX-like permease family protein [Saprospiraceae bacterium]